MTKTKTNYSGKNKIIVQLKKLAEFWFEKSQENLALKEWSEMMVGLFF